MNVGCREMEDEKGGKDESVKQDMEYDENK
jgi:hypothetical protein